MTGCLTIRIQRDFTSVFGSTTRCSRSDTVAPNSAGSTSGNLRGRIGQLQCHSRRRISPVAQAALGYFPKPNIPVTLASGNNNYTFAGAVPSTTGISTPRRCDVNSKWHTFLRYSMDHNTYSALNDFQDAARTGLRRPRLWHHIERLLHNTVAFSPTLIGEFRYGYSRQYGDRIPVAAHSIREARFRFKLCGAGIQAIGDLPHFGTGGSKTAASPTLARWL